MKKIMFLFLLYFVCCNTIYAKQGCCSHHGGINYCDSSGYYICNDGTKSPTCKCNNSQNELNLTLEECLTFQNDCQENYEMLSLHYEEIKGKNKELLEKNKLLEEKVNTYSTYIDVLIILSIFLWGWGYNRKAQ